MTVGEIKKVKKFLLGFDFYEITESCKAKSNTYKVELLDVWQEDGIIGFYDFNHKIIELDYSALKGFLLSSAELTFYKQYFIVKLKDSIINIKGLR